ncbi:sulfurtransferase-like selenium metabolism protein YedF [Helicobacter pametensis]|uniref:sulfurtransferase-like selenium metabolism protein YedF n=1 Tax=Helicobacter pametensis TaxID=95149 RepID=UPI000480FADE|nr:sulfurtransferase-like selenium metabolism protein YedF [Helicobacter pametensis]
MKEARIDVNQAVCADPVAKVKAVLEQIRDQNIAVSRVEIFGDHALEAIENFLINNGYIIETVGDEHKFSITLKGKEEVEVLEFLEEKAISLEDKVLFLKEDRIGDGEFGKKLLDRMIVALAEGGVFPKEILLLNRAVLLCSDTNREAMEELQYMQRKGVKILACRTCLEHYGILNRMQVGEVSSASIIMQKMMNTSAVISL